MNAKIPYPFQGTITAPSALQVMIWVPLYGTLSVKVSGVTLSGTKYHKGALRGAHGK